MLYTGLADGMSCQVFPFFTSFSPGLTLLCIGNEQLISYCSIPCLF